MLASRPHGAPVPENFRLEEDDIATPGEGQVLLRTVYLSLDPYMRGRMSDEPSYSPPVDIGGVMVGGTVSRVVESNHPDYQPGDWVLGYSGWQDYDISSGDDLVKLGDHPQNPSWSLGVLGMPGFTAYMGLLDIGQPKEGETLVLLDGTEAKLNADTLVIADHNKALAMGGIFGGEHSGVNEETQNVLLECAFFSPLSITGRARRHGLHTDASHRYERGVDPALQHKAMERATRLLIDICGGEAGPVIDITNEATLPKRATITLRRSKLDRLIGHHIADEQVTDILRRLGCEVTEGKDEWQAVAPSWRFDMEIEEDLVEEVARVYGYNNIPDEPVQASLIMGTHR